MGTQKRMSDTAESQLETSLFRLLAMHDGDYDFGALCEEVKGLVHKLGTENQISEEELSKFQNRIEQTIRSLGEHRRCHKGRFVNAEKHLRELLIFLRKYQTIIALPEDTCSHNENLRDFAVAIKRPCVIIYKHVKEKL